MNAAVIGLGFAGAGYVDTLNNVPGVKVTVVSDVNPALRAEFTGKVEKVTGNWEEIASDKDVDVVAVVTPMFLHLPMVTTLLEAGKNIICEKPIGMNADEVIQMMEAEKKSGKRLFVALNHRFTAANQIAKKVIQDGGIGRPLISNAVFIGNEFDRMNDQNSWKGTWDKAGGGIVIDGGTHVIDILNSFFGTPLAVTAVCRQIGINRPGKAEDCAAVSIEYKNGVLANLTATFDARYNTWPEKFVGIALRTEVTCLEGAISVNNNYSEVIIIDNKGNKKDLMKDADPSKLITNEVEHFIDCLRTDKTPIVTLNDALIAAKVVDAAYKSSATERRVVI